MTVTVKFHKNIPKHYIAIAEKQNLQRADNSYICVEVLWPSQPNGVMSSTVSLPKHTFTRQGLVLWAVNQYCAYSFARNWQLPFLDQLMGENDHRKNLMIKSPWKNVADPVGIKPTTSWSPVEHASNWATEAGKSYIKLPRVIFLISSHIISLRSICQVSWNYSKKGKDMNFCQRQIPQKLTARPELSFSFKTCYLIIRNTSVKFHENIPKDKNIIPDMKFCIFDNQ